MSVPPPATSSARVARWISWPPSVRVSLRVVSWMPASPSSRAPFVIVMSRNATVLGPLAGLMTTEWREA